MGLFSKLYHKIKKNFNKITKPLATFALVATAYITSQGCAVNSYTKKPSTTISPATFQVQVDTTTQNVSQDTTKLEAVLDSLSYQSGPTFIEEDSLNYGQELQKIQHPAPIFGYTNYRDSQYSQTSELEEVVQQAVAQEQAQEVANKGALQSSYNSKTPGPIEKREKAKIKQYKTKEKKQKKKALSHVPKSEIKKKEEAVEDTTLRIDYNSMRDLYNHNRTNYRGLDQILLAEAPQDNISISSEYNYGVSYPQTTNKYSLGFLITFLAGAITGGLAAYKKRNKLEEKLEKISTTIDDLVDRTKSSLQKRVEVAKDYVNFLTNKGNQLKEKLSQTKGKIEDKVRSFLDYTNSLKKAAHQQFELKRPKIQRIIDILPGSKEVVYTIDKIKYYGDKIVHKLIASELFNMYAHDESIFYMYNRIKSKYKKELSFTDIRRIIAQEIKRRYPEIEVVRIPRSKYDSVIAEALGYEKYIIEGYKSGKKIKEIAKEFEEKTGMHISSSTIYRVLKRHNIKPNRRNNNNNKNGNVEDIQEQGEGQK